jgi:hypothetical protein
MSAYRLSNSFAKIFVSFAVASVAGCTSDRAAQSGHERESTDAGPVDSGKVLSGLSLRWRIVDSGAVGSAQDAGAGQAPSATSLPGIPGVRVCVYQHAEIPCATSDSDGKFTLLGLPRATDLVLLTEKAGYVKTLRAIETASTPMDGLSAPLITTKTDVKVPDLGGPVDVTKGAISFVAIGTGSDGGLYLPEGVSVELSPGTAKGPFFTRANNTFDIGTTSSVGGVGVFLNVDPGDYELTFEYSAADCAPVSFPFGEFGFPVSPSSVKFPVMAGYVTDQVAVLCTPKSKFFSDAGASRDASSP